MCRHLIYIVHYWELVSCLHFIPGKKLRVLVCKYDNDFFFIYHLENVLLIQSKVHTYLSNLWNFLLDQRICHTKSKAETNKTYDLAAKMFLGLSLRDLWYKIAAKGPLISYVVSKLAIFDTLPPPCCLFY